MVERLSLAPEAAAWDWCGIKPAHDGGSADGLPDARQGGGIHYADAGNFFEVLRSGSRPRTGRRVPGFDAGENEKSTSVRLEPLMETGSMLARHRDDLLGSAACVLFRKDEMATAYLELPATGGR